MILKKSKIRAYQIIHSNNKRFFIKEYKDEGIEIDNLIRDEYQKGKKLCKLINYPEPLKVEKSKIFYEYIDIKCSLYDMLSKGIFDYLIIKKAGKFLKKIHENGIIFGDFTSSNIVITNDNKLFFIDASFSKYTNEYRVKFRKKNIYQDISLFLRDLQWIRPLNKPWLLLQRWKIKKAKRIFLLTYFTGNLEKFDKKKNMIMENRFCKTFLNHNQEHITDNIYRKYIWKLFINFVMLRNRWKYAKK